MSDRNILAVLLLILSITAIVWEGKGLRGLRRKKDRHIRSAAGEPKLSSAILWIVFIFGGIPFCFFVISRVWNGYVAMELLNKGVRAFATVKVGGLPTTECHYEFEVNGQRYRGLGSESMDVGEQLTVSYDPESPSVNRPADGLFMDVVFGVLFVTGLVISIVAALPSKFRSAAMGLLQGKGRGHTLRQESLGQGEEM